MMLGKYPILLHLTNSVSFLRAYTSERKQCAEESQTLLAENITTVFHYPLFRVLRKAENICKYASHQTLP